MSNCFGNRQQYQGCHHEKKICAWPCHVIQRASHHYLKPRNMHQIILIHFLRIKILKPTKQRIFSIYIYIYYATNYLWEKLYDKIPCKANKQCIYQKMSESYKYAKFCIFCCCDKRCVIMCDNAFSICKACACTWNMHFLFPWINT